MFSREFKSVSHFDSFIFHMTHAKIGMGFLLVLLSGVSSYANLQFRLDEFTTDRLTITILPSQFDLFESFTAFDKKGLSLFASDSQGRFGSTYVPNGSWINDGVIYSVEEAGPGSVGAVNFDISSSDVNYTSFAGPFLHISTPSEIVDGTSLTSPYQISFFGAGLFNPSAIFGFGLLPGHSNNSQNLQSVVSATPVPEPASCAALFGALAIAASVGLRRGKRSEERGQQRSFRRA